MEMTGRDDSMGKSLLAPGFRFHPTDEELVRYYLKRKVSKLPLRFDAIQLLDVYKFEPWDLPDKSKLKSRDLEWYFFSVLDKKYGNGSKTNRATQNGYWKTTGKDKPVYHKSNIVGMKKTLVFHSGRAPKGARSNWVMHEYRLVPDHELDKAGIAQDAFVLCRIFQKSGTGPKNGEQYGAPFVEEEWDEVEVEQELVMLPAEPEEATGEIEVYHHDAYAQPNHPDQDLYLSMPSENGPLLLDFYYGESSNNVDDSVDYIEDDTKPFIGTTGDSCGPEMPEDQKHFDLPEFNEVEPKLELDDYFAESSFNVNPEEGKLEMEDCFSETNYAFNPAAETDFLLSELQFGTTTSPPYDNALFLETNDLLGHVEADPSSFEMLDEYLAFFDTDTENMQNIPFESSKMIGTEAIDSVQAFLDEKHVNGGGTEQPAMNMTSQPLLNASEAVESSSSSDKKYESTKLDSDMQFPFSKEASRMLGKIHAPPAFASEYPTAKNASPLRFTSVGQASSSVHVRAGMIQISNMNLSFGKNGTVDLVVSFAIPQSDANFDDTYGSSRLLSGKNMSTAVSSVFFYLVCFWVLLLSMSYKIGTSVYAR